MAKQTFTTGQVLLASQLTSLQETAMGGGAASTKTASYVLVAADAGTTVAMNAAGSTTITVNSGLFSAGDTVFIQNIGAGATTITAGTATVNTAGSLILPQYDAGILYFTSASAAIFYDYIQVGATSPLTTKGDLYTYSTSDTRLGVGANGTVLTAASGEITGLKWETPASGAYTQLATGSLSGATTAFTGLSASYKDLLIVIRNYKPATDNTEFRLRFNSDTTANRHGGLSGGNWSQNNSTFGAGTSFQISTGNDNSVATGLIYLTIPDYTNTTTWKMALGYSMQVDATTTTNFSFNSWVGTYNQTAAISAVTFVMASGNFTSGDVIIYGVK